MAKGKSVLTTGDVARICNVAPRTVSKWFDSGQLKGYRIPGSKDRRIPVNELVRFMKANNMPMEALPLSKTRILVVDAGDGPASDLMDALTARGVYEVRQARSVFEAGACMQKFTPHVVLMNLLANGIDMHGLCRNIRANEDFTTVKVIALANQLGGQEVTALLQRGYDSYVSNPSDPGEIIKSIEQATAIIY